MVLEAGIYGESLIGSVTRKSYFPLLLQRHHPECATPKMLAFGKRLADILVQHIGWFGLASLDERTGFLSFPSTRFTYLRNYLKRSDDHISYSYEPGTRYQQRLVDLFFCFVDLFICFLHAFVLEHENLHKNHRDFHEP